MLQIFVGVFKVTTKRIANEYIKVNKNDKMEKQKLLD